MGTLVFSWYLPPLIMVPSNVLMVSLWCIILVSHAHYVSLWYTHDIYPPSRYNEHHLLYSGYPLVYSWNPLPVYWTAPVHLCYPPHSSWYALRVLNIPLCTTHPLVYCTYIIQGEHMETPITQIQSWSTNHKRNKNNRYLAKEFVFKAELVKNLFALLILRTADIQKLSDNGSFYFMPNWYQNF